MTSGVTAGREGRRRAGRLAVGVLTSCMAPLRLVETSTRIFRVAGVDSLFVPDHYVSMMPRFLWGRDCTPAARFTSSPDAFFDPYVMLGVMAARCRRVRIGTSVTESFRRHPATLAQAFVTLDHATRGHAILGIGNGERANTAPYGIPFTKRVRRLEEALTIIRRLWASGGEPVDFDGDVWRLRAAVFATPLYGGKAPCVWVAAHAPKMLQLTGRLADGWIPVFKMTPGEYRQKLATIRAAAEEAGRGSSDFEPALQVLVALGRDRQQVLEQLLKVPATAGVSLLIPGHVWKSHASEHPIAPDCEGFAGVAPHLVTTQHIRLARERLTPGLLADAIFAGSVNEVASEIQALADVGLRHIVFWNIGPLANPAVAADLFRFARLIRRCRKVALPRDHR